MRKIGIILSIFCLLFSCTCEKEQKKEILLTYLKDYQMRTLDGINGLHKKNGFFLMLCDYQKMRTSFLDLPKSQIDTLLKHNVIPSYFYDRTQGDEIGTLRKLEYNAVKDLVEVLYYEITDLEDMRKTVGKLYKFQTRFYTACINGGNLYISDTTSRYGCFIMETPPFLYPPSYFSKPVPKNIQVTSFDEKAKELQGEYIHISHDPYRIIKDEEVIKKGN